MTSWSGGIRPRSLIIRSTSVLFNCNLTFIIPSPCSSTEGWIQRVIRRAVHQTINEVYNRFCSLNFKMSHSKWHQVSTWPTLFIRQWSATMNSMTSLTASAAHESALHRCCLARLVLRRVGLKVTPRCVEVVTAYPTKRLRTEAFNWHLPLPPIPWPKLTSSLAPKVLTSFPIMRLSVLISQR